MKKNKKLEATTSLKKQTKKDNRGDSRIWKSPWIYKFYIPLVIIFFYTPILSLVLFSFNSSNSLITFKGFSFKWYERLFRSSALMDSLVTSLTVALIATVISVVIGTLGSIGLAYFSKKHNFLKNSILFANNIPIVNPEIVSAISLMMLFLGVGLSLGYVSMLLAHVSFCTPYVILSVYPKMAKIDKNLIEASMDLGCSRAKAVTKVIIPELLPSIISGAMMAFTMSFDDFVISYFTGGSQNNISTYLYSLKKTNPSVNALSTIIIFIVLAILLLSQFLQNRQSKKGIKAADVNGTTLVNNNSERKLVPNGSKEAIEVLRSEELLNEIDHQMEQEVSEQTE